MRKILLTQGQVTLVDDQYWNHFAQYLWHCDSDGYARRSITGGGTRILSREIMIYIGHDITNLEVDHIDRNRLNNQTYNLRVVTDQVQAINHNIQINNTSGFKGVYFERRTNRWDARIKVRKTPIYIGCFDSAIEAAYAYDKYARLYFGMDAVLNFP
jgi:hypothetical protein